MSGLQDKFRGCIAGSWIGSAMGAPVECWSREKIRETYGTLDRCVAYGNAEWPRQPGTTEDGIERQKVLATAIIEKQDRIRAEDLIEIWIRDYKIENVRRKQEGFDVSLLELALAGLPAQDLGKQNPFPVIISVARAFHPLGLINAGDPAGAADDVIDIGRVYVPFPSLGLRWAALYDAALAAACRPDATVASVLRTALDFADYRAARRGVATYQDAVHYEVERALGVVERSRTGEELMDGFYALYHGGDYMWYSQSMANEIVAKGLGIFAFTKGDPVASIKLAVNFGRDTDCLGAIAGGLSGALSGMSALPREWIDVVNAATRADPYTNNRRTIEETADGLLAAYRAYRAKALARLAAMPE